MNTVLETNLSDLLPDTCLRSEIKLQLLQLLQLHARLCVSDVVVFGRLQMFGHQLEVGLMEDNLGQILLSFDLFFDSVRDVWDDIGQDELGEVNDVLWWQEEEEHEEEEEEEDKGHPHEFMCPSSSFWRNVEENFCLHPPPQQL